MRLCKQYKFSGITFCLSSVYYFNNTPISFGFSKPSSGNKTVLIFFLCYRSCPILMDFLWETKNKFEQSQNNKRITQTIK